MTPKTLLLILSTPIAGAASLAPPCALLPSPVPFAVGSSRATTGSSSRIIHRAHDSDDIDDIHCDVVIVDDDDGTSVTIGRPDRSRRGIDRRSLISSFGATAVMASPASPARAAKGAAEYDLEYYMRDLLMGNNKEGNLPASNAPPPHPPRRLGGELLPLLLDDELSSCVPVRELSKVTDISVSALSEQIFAFRSKAAPAFRTTRPWKEEYVRDEYYFDLTCYALWRTASAAIPKDYSKRDAFARNVGRSLLDEILGRGMISKRSIETLSGTGRGGRALTLTDTVPCVIEILDLFKSSGYCTDYRLGDENDPERTGPNVFDELDDEELSPSSSSKGTGSVDCLVSVFDPSALGGALQITGEGSRFAPDFVGPTLAAVWERVGRGDDGNGNSVVGVRFESYFVDPVYRPNPKDFFPNERFYQFTIARK